MLDNNISPEYSGKLPFIFKLLLFALFCDPTGIFTFGKIPGIPLRISPTEMLTFIVLLHSIGKNNSAYKERLYPIWGPIVVLIVIMGINAISGVMIYGFKALNNTRYEFGIIMLFIILNYVRDEKDIKKIINVIILSIIANICIEILIDLRIIPIEVVRLKDLRDNVPLYDTPVMLLAFIIIANLSRMTSGVKLKNTSYFLLIVEILIVVLSLIRAVWVGLLIATIFVLYKTGYFARLKKFGIIIMVALGIIFLIYNYANIFSYREQDNVVAQSKSQYIWRISDDPDTMFRLFTGEAVLNELTKSIRYMLAGIPFGQEVNYWESGDLYVGVHLHNGYLSTWMNAGLFGLLSLLMIQIKSIKIGNNIYERYDKKNKWFILALNGALIIQSMDMFFNSNGGERQYIFYIIIGLILTLKRTNVNNAVIPAYS